MNLKSIMYRSIHKYIEKRLLTQKIFYLHIPKCGGTSINNAIASKYKVPIGFERGSIHLDAEASLKASRFCDMGLNKYREYLLPYFMSMKQVKFISGHFFINKRIFDEYNKQWDFITILRHPVNRWFSHYFYNRYKAGEHFKINDDIETFLESDIGQSLGHYYISILTGITTKAEIFNHNAAESAISILKDFSIVGCLEHLDIFEKQFEKRYGKALNVMELRKNPLAKSEQNQYVTEKIKKKVETICQPDLEIYDYALSQLSRLG